MAKMSTVWDRTAEFLSDNIGAVLPIALLAFFLPASIEGNFEAATAGAGSGLLWTFRLVQFAFALLSVWGTLALTAMALDMGSESETPGMIAGKRLPLALLVGIVTLVAVCALALPIPIVLAANGIDLNAIAEGGEIPMTVGIAGFVALYALAIAGLVIWLAARMILTTPVIVREGRGLGALRQSWRLTRGIALRVIGVIFLFALLSWVASLAANTVFGSVFALIAGPDRGGVTLGGVLTSIIVAAVQTAFTVLIPIFTAKLYLARTATVGLGEGVARA